MSEEKKKNILLKVIFYLIMGVIAGLIVYWSGVISITFCNEKNLSCIVPYSLASVIVFIIIIYFVVKSLLKEENGNANRKKKKKIKKR